MRINAKERKRNAKQWYQLLTNGSNTTAAVAAKRMESTNPNIFRVQLLACNTLNTPVVIAESVDGISGCLYELFQNIKKTNEISIYPEDDFADWLYKNYQLRMTYNDGLVLMFERETVKYELATEIIELFENLLDKKDIEIPCDDEIEQTTRYVGNNSAKLYGMEYFELFEAILQLL